MSIEALIDPAPATLRAAAARPAVASAMDEAYAALAQLRFSEGLRRGWEEARAEAAVREAAALAIIEGARTTVDDVRALSMMDKGPGGCPRAGYLALPVESCFAFPGAQHALAGERARRSHAVACPHRRAAQGHLFRVDRRRTHSVARGCGAD